MRYTNSTAFDGIGLKRISEKILKRIDKYTNRGYKIYGDIPEKEALKNKHVALSSIYIPKPIFTRQWLKE